MGQVADVERTVKIPVVCKQRNKFIPKFLAIVLLLTVVSLVYLDIDWLKLLTRLPDIGRVFLELAHLDFSNLKLIMEALLETVSIAVLSLLYSLALGFF